MIEFTTTSNTRLATASLELAVDVQTFTPDRITGDAIEFTTTAPELEILINEISPTTVWEDIEEIKLSFDIVSPVEFNAPYTITLDEEEITGSIQTPGTVEEVIPKSGGDLKIEVGDSTFIYEILEEDSNTLILRRRLRYDKYHNIDDTIIVNDEGYTGEGEATIIFPTSNRFVIVGIDSITKNELQATQTITEQMEEI